MHATIMRSIAVFACLIVSQVLADDAFFYEQVVPIFQRRCIGCHSDGDSKGDFSVESAELALGSGFIEPGDVDGSRFIEVITPVDGKAEMPKNADPMSAAEISTLRKWVQDGAKWPSGVSLSPAEVADFDWWSLKPLERPKIPNHASVTNPVDNFVLAKLAEHGLAPSPEADRQTLVRRLYFDLIGLPPSPKQVNQFVKDKDPRAYDKLVDELLASKHYGERWARHWLDVVHYADTHGYDKDKLRPNAWPYRDYVIRSFNEDKPYSQFVREQIAGDVLWPNSMDGITATGFIAAGPWDFIGHAEVPESKIDGRIARHLDRDDMVASTMNTFASTTVQCARCHNHKFDPITQEHYYSLQTIFAALDRVDRPYDKDPAVAEQRASLTQRKAALASEKSSIEKQIAERGGGELVAIDKRISDLEEQKKGSEAKPEFGYHSKMSKTQDAEKWFQIDLGETTAFDRVEFIAAHDDFGGIGAGFGFPLRFKIEVSDDVEFESSVATLIDNTEADVDNPGVEIQTVTQSATGRYLRMTATKLFHRKDTFIFAMGEFRIVQDDKNVARGKKVTALDSIEAPSRWQRKNLVDGYYYGKDAAPDLPAQLVEAKAKRKALIENVTTKELRSRFGDTTEELAKVESSIKALPPAGMVYAGTIHTGGGAFKGTGANGGKPRTINVLHRGDILQPRGIAEPGRIPLSNDDDWKFSLREEHSEGGRRVELANWLVDNRNPLTWRSIVNRVWHYHFGRGIVGTPNDFGRMGATPSHPELLDWLAVEFRDGGQSIKDLHKLIVTSSVYRQASAHNESNAEIDGNNQYLWRMNRRRLSAEEVRDAVLHVSGKLNPEMYGPGLRLFVLERPEHSPHYEYHKHDPDDPKSHRRTVYRFIVRSQPDPFMTTLDCADSSQSVAKRIETLTALQALSLLNNKFMLSMAEHFADRVAIDQQKVNRQVRDAYRLAVGHDPTKEQRKELVAYAKEFGLANACRLIFNLNEFVFVD